MCTKSINTNDGAYALDFCVDTCAFLLSCISDHACAAATLTVNQDKSMLKD